VTRCAGARAMGANVVVAVARIRRAWGGARGDVRWFKESVSWSKKCKRQRRRLTPWMMEAYKSN
jgi:hypothetical protein